MANHNRYHHHLTKALIENYTVIKKAAFVPRDIERAGMGPKNNYGDKLFWWSYGHKARLEPNPALVVTGKRLDGESPPAEVSRATNVLGESNSGGMDYMLVGVGFPTSGCWEITGKYRGQVLKFVVEVGDSR